MTGMTCKRCGENVNRIINHRGSGICMDCNDKELHRGKYSPKEEMSELDRRKHIAWMHRETYLDDEDFYNDQNEPSGQTAPT